MAVPVIIRPLPDAVLADLLNQALIGYYRGEPYLDVLRRFTRLAEAELQAQIFSAEHERARDAIKRERKRATAACSAAIIRTDARP